MNNGQELNDIERVESRGPQLFVKFTDGTVATVDNLPSALKGRSLDQIAYVEIQPSKATRVDATIERKPVRGLQLEVDELPFPIRWIMPTESAQFLGRGLAEATVLLPTDDDLRRL